MLHICLSFEFVEFGDMLKRLRATKHRFKERDLKRFALYVTSLSRFALLSRVQLSGLLNGLLHLHENMKYVHRDIK